MRVTYSVVWGAPIRQNMSGGRSYLEKHFHSKSDTLLNSIRILTESMKILFKKCLMENIFCRMRVTYSVVWGAPIRQNMSGGGSYLEKHFHSKSDTLLNSIRILTESMKILFKKCLMENIFCRMRVTYSVVWGAPIRQNMSGGGSYLEKHFHSKSDTLLNSIRILTESMKILLYFPSNIF